MKKITQILSVALIMGIITLSSFQAKAHCEIPCGIYGNSVRIALLYEHIETIEKPMNQINELSKSENPDYNQLERWVMNKGEYARKMQKIVSQYFLHQRVKITSSADEAAYRKYAKQLELLHHISVFAMKSKQSTGLSIINTLREKLHLFEHAYFGDDH